MLEATWRCTRGWVVAVGFGAARPWLGGRLVLGAGEGRIQAGMQRFGWRIWRQLLGEGFGGFRGEDLWQQWEELGAPAKEFYGGGLWEGA